MNGINKAKNGGPIIMNKPQTAYVLVYPNGSYHGGSLETNEKKRITAAKIYHSKKAAESILDQMSKHYARFKSKPPILEPKKIIITVCDDD